MSTLRERILARQQTLLVEKAYAEHATPGNWIVEHGRIWQNFAAPGAVEIAAMMGNRPWIYDADHIAAQDPRATIARVDRELAGIDADLALLDDFTVPGTTTLRNWAVARNLEARYPEDDQ